jgi:hypothetical protein
VGPFQERATESLLQKLTDQHWMAGDLTIGEHRLEARLSRIDAIKGSIASVLADVRQHPDCPRGIHVAEAAACADRRLTTTRHKALSHLVDIAKGADHCRGRSATAPISIFRLIPMSTLTTLCRAETLRIQFGAMLSINSSLREDKKWCGLRTVSPALFWHW